MPVTGGAVNVMGNQPRATEPLPERRVPTIDRARHAWEQLIQRLLTVTPRMLVRFLMVVAAACTVVWLFWNGRSELFWFFIGAVLAYLLLPLINWLEHWMPRWGAIVLVYVAIVVLGIGLLMLIVPRLLDQLGAAIQSLPDAQTIQGWIQQLHTYIKTLPPDVQTFINDHVKQLIQGIEGGIVTLIESIISFLFGLVSNLYNLMAFLFGFLVVPIWGFYVLRDQPRGKRTLDARLPGWGRADFWAVVRITDLSLGHWIRGQIVLSVVLAVEVFVGLNLLTLLGFPGIQYVLLLSFIAFITSPIPYVANALALIPALFMGLHASIETTIAIVIVYVLSQNVQDNILNPKIIGSALDIHPAILMPMLLLFTRFGIFWVVMAAPIAATARDLFLYAYGRFDDPPRPAGLLPRAARVVPTAKRAQAPNLQTAAPVPSEPPPSTE
jgi:predicted PurR-regulated permease PerM